MKSKRKDGLGHWPAGKRRNPDGGNWGRIRLTLRRFLDNHWEPGYISGRACAADLGVSERSVRKWIDGDSRPAPEMQEAVQQWVIERRTELRKRTSD